MARLKFDPTITWRDLIHIIVWAILLTAGFIAWKGSAAASVNSLGAKLEAVHTNQMKILKDVKQIQQTQDHVQVYLSSKDPHYWRIVGNIKLTPGPDPK